MSKNNLEEYWVQKDGTPIRYQDMSDHHLMAARNMLIQNAKRRMLDLMQAGVSFKTLFPNRKQRQLALRLKKLHRILHTPALETALMELGYEAWLHDAYEYLAREIKHRQETIPGL